MGTNANGSNGLERLYNEASARAGRISEGLAGRIERLEDKIRVICDLEKGTGEAWDYAMERGREVLESISSIRTLARRLEVMGERGQALELRRIANDLTGSLNFAIRHDPDWDQASAVLEGQA